MKKIHLLLLVCFAMSLSVTALKAQPGFDDDITDTPVDGGISLLVGAGLIYGLKKKRMLEK